jgi:hypothetical protein
MAPMNFTGLNENKFLANNSLFETRAAGKRIIK